MYSSEKDGRSFNRLEWALLGYEGPTLVVVKTTEGAVIGAFTDATWKDSVHYFGNTDAFLFQLEPEFHMNWAIGPQENYMYLHSSEHGSSVNPTLDGLPHGLGFGGNLTTKPRLFIPESLEHCVGGFFDKTFQSGEILPQESLERFEINVIEAWGVGTNEAIDAALSKRLAHRNQTEDAIRRAREVTDKTQFLRDLESGFTPSKLYDHKKDTRGRHEFKVDDQHGGYKVERE